MSKGTVKAAVLALIFVVSLLVFGRLMNFANEDLTTEMDEASLPVIYLYENGIEINELHGYTDEMDASYMRDTITPIGDDRLLPINILTYQEPIQEISYEIRSLDASRLVADATLEDYDESRGRIRANLEIQNLLEEGEEYLLIISLTTQDGVINYYTRILENEDAHVQECVDFAVDFNEKTFDSENISSLASYMEKTSGDNTTLNYVSLNSSLKQIGWGDLEVSPLSDIVPSIKEITDTYTVVMLNYSATAVDSEGITEYFNVSEYYRVRYTAQRIYLLDFERTLNQLFRGETTDISDNVINLGIRDSQVEYKANESGNKVAFVQEGELWSFDISTNSLIKVFSFNSYEGLDDRENYDQHDIKIARVDETGSLDFIVYGYMNRGIHEGQVGIAVYHYDSTSNTNEEMVFIPSTHSYGIMKAELGQLLFVNDSNHLYLMVGSSLYDIDLMTLKYTKAIENLTEGQYAISDSNNLISWVDTDEEGLPSGSTIHIMNFTTGKTSDVSEKSGLLVKPLGFMDEDLVYGLAEKSSVYTDAAGNVTFPMYELKIIDSSDSLDELKTYEKSGYYIESVDIEDYTMYINRIQYNGTAYVEADRDMIMNREGDSGDVVSVTTVSDETKETEIELSLTQTVASKSRKLLTPKETVLEEERLLSIEEDRDDNYYVYAKGQVLLETDSISQAVKLANEEMGLVVDSSMEYIWMRSRASSVTGQTDVSPNDEDADAGSIAKCISAMLHKEGVIIGVNSMIEKGETPKNILNDALKDDTVLDLSGADLDSVLYYISCGSPVFAMTGSDSAVLIVGYDSNNITVYDPSLGTVHKMTQDSANTEFAAAGNVFFTYIK